MQIQDLTLRCMAKRREGQWVAFCIDLGLATQGDSLEEVRGKLDEQIRDHIREVMAEEDPEIANDLLHSRKAPLWDRMEYHALKTPYVGKYIGKVLSWVDRMGGPGGGGFQPFICPIRMKPEDGTHGHQHA